MTALDVRGFCAQDLREYPEGTVYIGHLDGGLADTSHAKHYTGHADPGRLAARWAQQSTSEGARILQVQRERGGTWHWVATFPGTRATERAFKDTRNITRYRPDCTPEPYQKIPPPAPRRIRPAIPSPRAEPGPRQPAATPHERGVRSAERFLAERAGQGAEAIAAAYEFITGPYRQDGPRTAAAAAEIQAFTSHVDVALERLRESERAQAAPAQPQEGAEMSTDAAQDKLAKAEAQPATEWMKGAATAHDLIARQVEAGQNAETIAAKWDEALATYDDASATGAEREWHAGAEETARDMIQTWREMEQAEAEDAQAARDAHEPAPETGDGWSLYEEREGYEPPEHDPEAGPEPEPEMEAEAG